jgi:phosphoadenosine phosphosulfate reductase
MHFVLGVRKSESTKRKDYQSIMNDEFYINHFGKNTNPKLWVNVAPIIDWDDIDVWLYIIKNKIPYNIQYDYGYPRVGCLICPYQHDYVDILTKHYYPKMWDRWLGILSQNYNIANVENRLKWNLQEWFNGKWKQATSVEQDLISKKKNPELIQKMADVKGISLELAEKYWDNSCCKCGKKLNVDEVAINLKLKGRNIDMSKCECGKCIQQERHMTRQQYSEWIQDFRNDGCNLF